MGEPREREKLLERITLRLDEQTMARLETYARRLEDVAGVRLSRGEIARRVIVRGLDCMDEDAARERARE